MKRSDIGGINRELVQERAQRRKMSAAEREIFDRRRDLLLNNAILQSDPEGTARYLCKLAMRLEDGEPLPHEVRRYVANAITETAIDPKNSGRAFGLISKQGRPKIDGRKICAAMETVAKLHAERVPLKDSRKGEGAFSLAAKEHRLSTETIKEWWGYRQSWLRDNGGK